MFNLNLCMAVSISTGHWINIMLSLLLCKVVWISKGQWINICDTLSCSKDFKIIWLSNILALSVPHEGYSRSSSCALNLISTFLFFIKQVFFRRIYLKDLIDNNTYILLLQERGPIDTTWLGRISTVVQDVDSYCTCI